MPRLRDVAAVLRSKNAGPFLITLDLLFEDAGAYRRVHDAGVLAPDVVARLYGVPAESVRVIAIESVLAIKVTLPRARSAGSPADTDVYGAQQHAPLLELEVPE